jgi:hypothetical protein
MVYRYNKGFSSILSKVSRVDKMKFAVHMCQAVSIVIGSLIFPYCQGNIEYKTVSIKNKEASIQTFVKSFNKTLYYLDRFILDQYNLLNASGESERNILIARIDDSLDLLNDIECPYEMACSVVLIHFSDRAIQDKARMVKSNFDYIVDTQWGKDVDRSVYDNKRAEIVRLYEELLIELTKNLEDTRVEYGFPN